MSNYIKHVNVNKTPQTEKIPGKNQVKNNAGGFVFGVDDWTALDRFLILGAEGGSYYASEKTLTKENASRAISALKADGKRYVDRVVEISVEGRAPKNDPAIFALALACKLGDDKTRKLAYDALPKVCRIGTHLFAFVEAIEGLGGWSRGARTAVANWYNKMPIEKLGYQLAKYQQRNGWSHKDLFRLAHPKTVNVERNSLYKWAVKGVIDENTKSQTIVGFERAKGAKNVSDLIKIISEYRLPHECVPTEYKNDPKVQEELLKHMPLEAMIRNLGNMSKSGLLTPLSNASSEVIKKLEDKKALHDSRIHPVKVLAALMTYKNGRGVLGKGTWTPVQSVVDALDSAFYESFNAIIPTGKKFLLGLDISGSMGIGTVAGVPGLTPLIASGAMAMAIAKSEKNYECIGFTSGKNSWVSKTNNGNHWSQNGITQLNISPKMRLDTVVDSMQKLTMGGTDCALPMLYASAMNRDVDCFIVITDNETWAGSVHPTQALNDYRKNKNSKAKSVVIGMTATSFSIADPNDAGMLDVVGFDTNVPSIISDFVR